MSRSSRASAGSLGSGAPRRAEGRVAPGGAASAESPSEPCLHCGHPVPLRLMGCKGGHCPNCRHPYPHGDCSD